MTININGTECVISKNNVHIVDQYKIKDIEGFVKTMRPIVEEKYTYTRTQEQWIIEWYAHNLLYKLGMYRDHTKDVDLNEDETQKRLMIYNVLYPIAKLVL